MRDPHVVSLRYCLETDPSLIFDKPSPREEETDQVTLCLAEDILTCKMKAHYATADAARAVVDPLLRAWQLHVALSHGKQVMYFVYQKAEMIDRDPPPPGVPQVIQTTSIESVEAVDHATVVLTQPHYPELPTRFTASPDVETLWNRYEGSKQGREPLLPMAYFCLSLLQWRASSRPGRKSVAQKVEEEYSIAWEIVKKLGDLTTNLGDEHTARKFTTRSKRRPPTAQESTWIDDVIRRMIRRVGEHAADPTASWPMLSMHDLPPLK